MSEKTRTVASLSSATRTVEEILSQTKSTLPDEIFVVTQLECDMLGRHFKNDDFYKTFPTENGIAERSIERSEIAETLAPEINGHKIYVDLGCSRRQK